LKAVLGDCGFVSVAKYAKVDRTASIYRDPNVSHSSSHDMFSFGICFLEMIAEIKISRQATYDELKQIVNVEIKDKEYRKIIYNLLHEDKNRRPSARFLLKRLFNENPPKWIKPDLTSFFENKSDSVSEQRNIYIRNFMKNTVYEYEINRGKKGYFALIHYIDNNLIDPSLDDIYMGITLMILSSIFGKSGFREIEVLKYCKNKYNMEYIFSILDDMLSDVVFINLLLFP
jgi:serine/threonine protein kinase